MTIKIQEQVVESIRLVIGANKVSLHEPEFTGNEKQYLADSIDSTFVSYVGEYVSAFEQHLANYTGAKEAVALVNGTSALHMALMMAGVSRQDEVLIPALTFVATANAVVYCGAIPHFVDCDEKTLGVDVNKLHNYLERVSEVREGKCFNRETGRIIKAFVPMHTFGHPVDMASCLDITTQFKLVMIEDAAESLGSFYDGKHTGTFCDYGVLSFNGNKIVTTGGGGALLFNDSVLAQKARHLSTTAKEPHAWEYHHDEIGYNYRMPNVNAAVGCAQMEQLPEKLEKKRTLYKRYADVFDELEGISLFREPENCHSNYWLQALLLDDDDKSVRDSILALCNENGIMARPAWNTLDTLPMFNKCPADNLDNAHSLYRRLINIPSSPGLVHD